jgi:hypothetical protein
MHMTVTVIPEVVGDAGLTHGPDPGLMTESAVTVGVEAEVMEGIVAETIPDLVHPGHVPGTVLPRVTAKCEDS